MASGQFFLTVETQLSGFANLLRVLSCEEHNSPKVHGCLRIPLSEELANGFCSFADYLVKPWEALHVFGNPAAELPRRIVLEVVVFEHGLEEPVQVGFSESLNLCEAINGSEYEELSGFSNSLRVERAVLLKRIYT